MMNKKILVLEPSTTTQSLIFSKFKKSNYDVSFESNGIKFLVTAYNTCPDIILVNAKFVNPKSNEIIRLIKNVEKFKKIPVGAYATSDFAFVDHYLADTGADCFINFEAEDLFQKIDAMLEDSSKNKLFKPMSSDILKGGIAEKIFSFIKDLEYLDNLVEEFLNLLTEFCEVPAISLFLMDEDGADSYFLYSKNFTDAEKEDFRKVCITDFEQLFPDTNILKSIPKQFESINPIEKYHTGDIPLSAFHCVKIYNSNDFAFGTLNLVREGTFTSHQLDLVEFSVRLFSMLLEFSLTLKMRIKFERNVRKAFSRFVPEQIIDNLVNNADQSNNISVGEKRNVAILFSDIRSFTSISELNKPETIVAFLNRYFTTMCTIIKKHGGTVDKFIGDAIMALFGAPVSYEDNCRRAVAAAYEMREALASVPLEDLILPPGMNFNIGIGIHYGDVIVGSIGSNDKTDYSVIGDNVNLASRMEGLTKTYGSIILITQAVKEDISSTVKEEDDFVYRYLDDVKVKGKEKSVPIFAVDRSADEFSKEYKDAYTKAFENYKIGAWELAIEYFEKALKEVPDDKAAKLMLERSLEFRENPPENWDGAITFHTK